MNIGSMVRGRRMSKNRHGDSVTWVELGHVTGMYLGWVQVYDGQWEHSTHPDHFAAEWWFVQKRAHRVAVVQPIGSDGRFRKPIYAVLDSLEAA